VTGPFRSYLADLTDPTFLTAEVDLNGFEVGNGPFETDPNTFDLGAPAMDGVWLNEAGKDEDVLSAHRRGRVPASFDLRIAPVTTQSFANLQAQLRKLNAALDRSGVWVLQQPGSSTPLYIDYYPSDLIQQLMPGQRSLYFLWTELNQPNGMRVTILRRPKMRGAALDASWNKAHNGTLAEPSNPWDGTPWGWAWSDLTGISALDYDWTYGAHQAALATGAAKFFYQQADADIVEAAHTYTFAADVAATYSRPPTIRARIDWLDADENVIDTSYGSAVEILLGPRNAFSRPFVAAAAPAGAVGALYGIEVHPVSTATVSFYVRDTQFETGVSANTFRPGFETISQNPGDPFYKRIWLKNSANADALGQIRATPSVGAEVARMIYARRSGERDSAMAMRQLPGWAAADSTSLLSGATTTSDGGRTVVLTALEDDVMKPVLRQAATQPEESALKGVWRWKVALRGDVDDAYDFELRYGMGDVVDLPRTMERRQLDLTGPPASSGYYEIDLGLMRIPANSPGVFIELWAMRETTDDGDGDGEIYIDQLWPEPADDDLYAIASIPGAQQPGPVTETVIGRKLVTPPDGLSDDPDSGDPFVEGSVYNDDMLLNDTLEAASLPAGMTDDLTPDVQHTFVAKVTMFTASEKVARKHGEFRIHDLTDDVQVKMVSLKNDPGIRWDEKTATLRLVPTSGHAYQVYAVQTVASDVGNIHVEKIDHSFVPPVEGGTETIAIDADQRRAYVLDADDQFVDDLDLVPPFPTLMPKVQLYRVSAAGLGPDGSDDVLDGGPALAHDPDLTIEFGVHVIPRYFN